MITLTKWKHYKTLKTGLIHYVNLEGSNYEAQVIMLGRGGKELKNKAAYQVYVTNGYNGLTNKQVIRLREAKLEAERMLVDCFNQINLVNNYLK